MGVRRGITLILRFATNKFLFTCKNLSKAGLIRATRIASSARLTLRINPVYASRTDLLEN